MPLQKVIFDDYSNIMKAAAVDAFAFQELKENGTIRQSKVFAQGWSRSFRDWIQKWFACVGTTKESLRIGLRECGSCERILTS